MFQSMFSSNVFKMFITCDNKKIFGKTFGNRLVHTCAEEYKLSFPLSYHTYTYHASTGKQSNIIWKKFNNNRKSLMLT